MALFDETPRGEMSHEQFFYPAAPSICFGRTGWGPLIVSLDTDLLIHLAQNLDEIGGSFGFDGRDFMPETWDNPIRALHDIFVLWFWRDVRIFLPPEQMDDGPLTADRENSRRSILDALSEDFWQRGGFERSSRVADERVTTGTDLAAPREWPASLKTVLPKAMDGVLVKAALTAGVHVFLSADRHSLRRAQDLARFSLAVMKPGQLLEALDASGELALPAPGRRPSPDLQSLSHFYRVVPQCR